MNKHKLEGLVRNVVNHRHARLVRKSDESRQTKFVAEMEARRRDAQRRRGTDLKALATIVQSIGCHADEAVVVRFRDEDGLTYLAEGPIRAYSVDATTGELRSVWVSHHIDAEQIIAIEPKLTAEQLAAVPLAWLEAARQSQANHTKIHVEYKHHDVPVAVEGVVVSLNSGRDGKTLLWVNIGGHCIDGLSITALYPKVEQSFSSGGLIVPNGMTINVQGSGDPAAIAKQVTQALNNHPNTLRDDLNRGRTVWDGPRADA